MIKIIEIDIGSSPAELEDNINEELDHLDQTYRDVRLVSLMQLLESARVFGVFEVGAQRR